MKTSKTIILAGVAAVTVAAVGWLGYTLGREAKQRDHNELLYEVEKLRAEEKDAAVTKRVSQQMEAIAYEQMNVSNTQRDRAEEQSRLAEANAARAEEQSRLAQANAERAQQQSLLAEKNEQIARMAAKEAEAQRDAANYSKSISDTLSFRTLSRSLGTTSISQNEISNRELSQILAYASWYFVDKYKGNPYQNETFQALLEATNSIRTYTTPNRGAVNAVAGLKQGRDGCVAVTNYGEVAMVEKGKMRMLLENNMYDFRDVWLNEKNIFALSYSGQLCILDYNKLVGVELLPTEKYFKLLELDETTLLIAGRHSLTWFDLRTMKAGMTLKIEKELTALVKRRNQTFLFYGDGTCDEMDGTGKRSSRKTLSYGVVTSAMFSETMRVLFLGLNNGDIVMLDDGDRYMTTLSGHVSKVTGLAYRGKILVSSCYDRELYIWNLPKLKANIKGGTLKNDTEEKDSGTPREWLVPAGYTSKAWALCVCTKADWAWLGLSDGRIIKYCVSVSYMSDLLRKQLKRTLTHDEWMQYVGPSVDYIDFLKGE